MAAPLSPGEMAGLLAAYYPDPPAPLIEKLLVFLELLLKWNARTNLTAIRSPAEIVRRHFGESLFVAAHLPSAATALDLGSGAGFPGIPVQLARPELQVTLAESQHKKSAFLREAVRALELPSEVWPRRVEEMALSRTFDLVMLRAVDRPELALLVARKRVANGGLIAHLTTGPVEAGALPIPGTRNGILHLFRA
jgi:16S rRNA (guanine527-N7)-methyltransferase